MNLKNQLKREFGFYSFAWLPVRLTSGEYIWFKNVFYAGRRHGATNRYAANGNKKYELIYESGPIKLK